MESGSEAPMQTASEEMRDFASQRSELLIELASCTVAAAALWMIAGRLEGALPELKGLFFALLVAFGVAVQQLVLHLIPVLAFRCPRCTMLFHAATDRLGVRACAHCRLPVRGSDSPQS
jgi:hypothetical protein